MIFLFLLTVFLLTFFSLRKIFSKDGGRTLLSETSSQAIKEKSAQKRYTVNVEYPGISGLDNLAFQESINEEIKTWAEREVAQFKKDNENPPKINALKDAEAQLSIQYSVLRLDARILSLSLEEYQYSIGQAHGTTSNTSFNYSTKDQKKLLLVDLFKPKSNYLQKLSQISEAQLIKDLENDGVSVDKDLVHQGTLPKEENFRTFLIDKENLVLIFDPYQVAAGVAGTRKVVIPFSKLQKELVNLK